MEKEMQKKKIRKMRVINEFIFCSLLLWQIGIISYILLNKFYGKNPKKIIQEINQLVLKLIYQKNL